MHRETTTKTRPGLESFFMQHYATRIAQAAATLWEARNELRWDPATADLFEGDSWVVLDTRDKVAAAIEDIRAYLDAIDRADGLPLQRGTHVAASTGSALFQALRLSGPVSFVPFAIPDDAGDARLRAERTRRMQEAAACFSMPVWDLLQRTWAYGDRWHAPSGTFWPEIPGVSFGPLAEAVQMRLDRSFRFSLPRGRFRDTLHTNLIALPAHHLAINAYRALGDTTDLAPLLRAAVSCFPMAFGPQHDLHVLVR